MPPSKKPAAKQSAKVTGDPDLDLISSLASILNSSGLTEIELDRKGTRFRVSKSVTTVAAAPAAVHAPLPHAAPGSSGPAAEPAAAAKPANGDHPGTVKSPMVGTVYRAPSPEAPNFVDVGSTVKEGQTLLIIEAMKTMNQIHAPRGGRVTHVFVESGQPVEFGEALVVIE
jgi:acetyl-CoA carboxylase biotin carboxyl carrier protein